jgi:hypothetical protein
MSSIFPANAVVQGQSGRGVLLSGLLPPPKTIRAMARNQDLPAGSIVQPGPANELHPNAGDPETGVTEDANAPRAGTSIGMEQPFGGKWQMAIIQCKKGHFTGKKNHSLSLRFLYGRQTTCHC